MTPAFFSQFRELHEKAKKGALTPDERKRYMDARGQFSRVVVVAQQLGHAGTTLRADMRMAKMLKVELRPDAGEPSRLSTIDLATAGFAVLMQVGSRVGTGAGFTLYLPSTSGPKPITGRCTVASSRPQTGAFRVSFKFEPLLPEAQEQLDFALIDAVLERFSFKGP